MDGRTWYIDIDRCPYLFGEAISYVRRKNREGKSIAGKFQETDNHGIDSVRYSMTDAMLDHIPEGTEKYYVTVGNRKMQSYRVR